MAESKIKIIGISDDGAAGLTEAARSELAAAELVLGEAGPLAAVEAICPGEKHVIGGDLDKALEMLRAQQARRTVVLASGDPLFYGTARFLCQHLGKDRFEVMPHVSSMQLAFARVKESWDDAYLANLASQPLDRVLERIRTSQKSGLFTTETMSPQHVARALLERQIDYFQAYICENLGSPDECVTQTSLAELAEMPPFASLNVMVLVRDSDRPERPRAMTGARMFGNRDEMFLQSKAQRGLLTPTEVRTIALAEMSLSAQSVVWDVGAGSGSVAVEAAQLATAGEVYAIEMSAEDHGLIAENAERFGVANLIPVLGQAPQAWQDLPDPDAIFVGGTGRVVGEIVEHALRRLKSGGRIVVNVGSIDNLSNVRQLLEQTCGECQAWMVQVARGNPQFDQLRFESLQPTFLLGATQV
ncbi:MAG: precorrin-6y C5,15-methyltransferase (decarboxylating) subunit CbiE [Planctomycetales bacterium]|nr:precorrin-6y C5,15-methyltransferase (decarboxylating) subunit CbiE [Planctomycetales bacterium]